MSKSSVELAEYTLASKYRLLRPLGTGGMSQVYEAEHTWTGRGVAVKLLTAETPASRERFFREARSVAKVEHPNVVQVLDMGIDEGLGTPFVVFPLLRGETLRARMASGSCMSPAGAVRVLAPVLRGLAVAHAAGIVHRDVKPGNIVLARERVGERGECWTPTLIDFGIAKVVGEHEVPDLTLSGAVVGTPHYMSPEQATGRTVDARADVWSLGVVLYELLSGRRPFEGPTLDVIALRIVTGDFPKLDPERVPEKLSAVVYQALSVEPRGRYADARDMLAALAATGVCELSDVPWVDAVLLSTASAPAPAPSEIPTVSIVPSRERAPEQSGVTSSPPRIESGQVASRFRSVDPLRGTARYWPFGATAPHFVSPNGGVLSWIVEPAGMYNVILPGHVLDLEAAEFIASHVDGAMRRRFPGAKYFYVHDFSRASDYVTDARLQMVEWGRRSAADIRQLWLAVPSAHRFFRMAAAAALASLRATGVPIDLVSETRTKAHQAGLRPAVMNASHDEDRSWRKRGG